jgi:hypothetical protein
VAFAEAYKPQNFLDLWYPATYNPLVALFAGTFPGSVIIGSDQVEWILLGVPILINATRLALAVACLLAFLRPGRVETQRLVLLTMLFVFLTSDAGGYSQIFVLMLLFMERWDTWAQKCSIFLGYLLSLPGDFAFHQLNPIQAYSYYAGRVISLEYGVPILSFVRPALMLAIAFCLALDTIQKVRAAQAGDRLDAPRETTGDRVPRQVGDR